MSIWQRFIDWLFASKNIELCMVGLENAGKTSLVNLLASNDFKTSVVPTVGFNMKQVRRGNVIMKVWDLGGQVCCNATRAILNGGVSVKKRFRGMWERYCRGVQAIVFVVDSAKRSEFSDAAKELNDLISKPSIENVPLLIVANKMDLPDVAKKSEIIDALNSEALKLPREIAVFQMSCKTKRGYSQVLQWLIRHSYYEDQ